MDSSEIGTWVGNAITTLSVILFIIVERDRLFSRNKAKQTEPISSNLVDIGLIDNLRSLIYTRILVGLIIGFAINRLLVWVFIEYSKFDGLFSNLEIPLTVLRVSISSALAVLFGLFFGLLYVRFSHNLKTFYHHWIERTIVALILFGILAETYSVNWDGYENIVYGATPFLSMFFGVLIMLLLSFPLSPLEIVTVIIKKWNELLVVNIKK
jgi:hypothetical protein